MQRTTKRPTQPAHCFRRLFCASLVCALTLGSVRVAAEEPVGEIGILAADTHAGSQQAARRLAEHLKARGVVVYDDEAIRSAVARTLVDPADHGSAPAGLTESISRGIRQFFYQSRRDAVETLSEAVDRGLDHLPALARRPDLADQVYEAGIVLVRAARITEAPGSSNDGSGSMALETVERLATQFPTRTPSMETAPPEIVDLFEKAHAETATQATTLHLEVPDGCKAMLNGMRADTATIAVVPGVAYYLRLDCVESTSPLRTVTLERGQARRLPLFVGQTGQAHPATPAKMQPDTATAEDDLRRMWAWSGVDTLLAVRQRGRGPSRHTTVIRLSGGGTATSRTREGRFDPEEYIGETFELEPLHEPGLAGGEVPMDRADGRGLDIGLVAGGGVSMAASTWLLVAAAKNQRLLRCSANAANPLPDGRCEGASTRGLTLSPADTDRREAQVNRQRILGIALGTVGLAAGTWGIIRMLSTDGEPQTAHHDRATTHVVFTNRSASLVITF